MSVAYAPSPEGIVGQTIQGRYRILRKLGQGGMGAVYEAEHVLIQKRVAIKTLLPELARNPDLVARFRREALAATAIHHPHIIEVNDMGELPDGSSFMVLEYLEGRDWSKDLELEGPQPLGKVVHVLTQVCDALSAAHDKGIVHRDLKPENIYLIRHGEEPNFVKVLDFGISKIRKSDVDGKSLTATGTAMGTAYYMSPEQTRGAKDMDHRTDIWSLGVILFEALTGHFPFDDEAYPMLVLKINTEPTPSLLRYRADLPPQLDAIFQRALAKHPDQRFASCAELKAALLPYRGANAAPVLTGAESPAASAPSVLSAPPPGEAGASGGWALPPADPAQTGRTAPLPAADLPGATPYAGPAPVDEGLRSRLPLLLVVALVVVGGMTAIGAGVGYWLFARPSTEVADADDPPPAPIAATPTGGTAPEPVPEPVPEPTAPPTSPPEQATAPESARAPSGEEATAQVHLRLRTEPAGAELRINGQPVSNPYHQELPRSSEPLHVEATHAGYHRLRRDLIPDRDLTATLALQSRTGGTTSAHHGTTGTTGTTGTAGNTNSAMMDPWGNRSPH